ncbi:hypothetical protein [Sphingobium sp. TCM1]|uniref:hypothetical protein n=1 Tax=Sphingobium sp. TCM1 TaxID=453246 RepID=UPI0007F4510D|nr:hypothetical protein [Sphingobium sp. TCM1]OAN52842.1 hypothetical protein A7Q26_06500 [Sphingobium sp. TCM1]
MTTENRALMEALEPTWANRELANAIRNLMRQGGWDLATDAHVWRADHPLLQAIAVLSRLAQPADKPEARTSFADHARAMHDISLSVADFHAAVDAGIAPLPAEREADGEAVGAKPWYETDAHRDLSRIIPDMEGKIADAEKRFAHCLPDHLFAPLKASITELRVLRHELSALSAQPVSEQEEEGWKSIDSAPMDGTWCLLFGALYDEPHVRAGFWGEDGDWFDSEAASTSLTCWDWQPTHWKEFSAPQTDGGKA